MSNFKISDKFDAIIKEILFDTLPSSFVEDFQKLKSKKLLS